MADGLKRPTGSVLRADFVDWHRLWDEVGSALFEEETEYANELIGTINVAMQHLQRISWRLTRAVADG